MVKHRAQRLTWPIAEHLARDHEHLAAVEVIEKRRDQRGINCLERQSRRRRMQPLLCKFQQQTEGIAIRTNRMRTGLPLLHETLGEEPFQ